MQRAPARSCGPGLGPRAAAAAATVVMLACAPGGQAPGKPVATHKAEAGAKVKASAEAGVAVELVSCVDLPQTDARSHNLSGLAWDPVARQLFAISDKDRWLTVLEPRPGFAGFDLGPSIELDIDVDPWDGEAVALVEDGFLVVANETTPNLVWVDRRGRGARALAVPGLRGIRDNLGIEGLGYAASAEGRFVFAVNEQALEGDGPLSTIEHGTRVRILRHSLDGRADFAAVYLTDPIFADSARGDNGVSDLAPLSPDRMLVLERAYVSGRGNAARIYEVDLRGAQNIAGLGDVTTAVPVRKRLIVDVATLPDDRCSTPPMPQRRRTLENYEGLALGPSLPDGRRAVFLVSDDNERPSQIPRLLTLAIAPSSL
ncbi:MAG TPA: esterase-like activity of phytase family protein [Kofleriaceae bacterium]|nr:esterase-like activity of phytase family protein [Kofleriaceae bacterium]